jgi:hypothetical protein
MAARRWRECARFFPLVQWLGSVGGFPCTLFAQDRGLSRRKSGIAILVRQRTKESNPPPR